VSRVALDASCLVAAASQWHDHHSATIEAIGRLTAGGHEAVVPAHALAEAYAVLTRLPQPHRVTAAEALAILEGTWRDRAAASLDEEATWSTLASAAAADVIGGAVYDALIAAAAERAGADSLLTWNARHFERLSFVRLRIVTPEVVLAADDEAG